MKTATKWLLAVTYFFCVGVAVSHSWDWDTSTTHWEYISGLGFVDLAQLITLATPCLLVAWLIASICAEGVADAHREGIEEARKIIESANKRHS